MRSFREIGDKAENLLELGYKAENDVRRCKSFVVSASWRVAEARSELDYARQVDEDGNYRGDVSAAQSRLRLAQIELERCEIELSKARRYDAEIRNEKRDHIDYINRYASVEESNIEKIGLLVDDAFGSDSEGLMQGVTSRHDRALEIKRVLLDSMNNDIG